MPMIKLFVFSLQITHLADGIVVMMTFNPHIRGAQGRNQCFVCGGGDHFATTCLTKRRGGSSNSSSSFAYSAPRLPTPRVPAFRTPFLDPQSAAQSTEFCRSFNFKTCTFRQCKRIHRCIKCNQNHPASSCTSFQS